MIKRKTDTELAALLFSSNAFTAEDIKYQFWEELELGECLDHMIDQDLIQWVVENKSTEFIILVGMGWIRDEI